MDKKGVAWRYIIIGIIVVVVLVLILLFTTRSFSQGGGFFTDKISELNSMDLSEMTTSQKEELIENEISLYNRREEIAKISDLDMQEKELNDLIDVLDNKDLETMSEVQKQEHVNLYLDLAKNLKKQKKIDSAMEKAIKGYKLFYEYEIPESEAKEKIKKAYREFFVDNFGSLKDEQKETLEGLDKEEYSYINELVDIEGNKYQYKKSFNDIKGDKFYPLVKKQDKTYYIKWNVYSIKDEVNVYISYIDEGDPNFGDFPKTIGSFDLIKEKTKKGKEINALGNVYVKLVDYPDYLFDLYQSQVKNNKINKLIIYYN